MDSKGDDIANIKDRTGNSFSDNILSMRWSGHSASDPQVEVVGQIDYLKFLCISKMMTVLLLFIIHFYSFIIINRLCVRLSPLSTSKKDTVCWCTRLY